MQKVTHQSTWIAVSPNQSGKLHKEPFHFLLLMTASFWAVPVFLHIVSLFFPGFDDLILLVSASTFATAVTFAFLLPIARQDRYFYYDGNQWGSYYGKSQAMHFVIPHSDVSQIFTDTSSAPKATCKLVITRKSGDRIVWDDVSRESIDDLRSFIKLHPQEFSACTVEI